MSSNHEPSPSHLIEFEKGRQHFPLKTVLNQIEKFSFFIIILPLDTHIHAIHDNGSDKLLCEVFFQVKVQQISLICCSARSFQWKRRKCKNVRLPNE